MNRWLLAPHIDNVDSTAQTQYKAQYKHKHNTNTNPFIHMQWNVSIYISKVLMVKKFTASLSASLNISTCSINKIHKYFFISMILIRNVHRYKLQELWGITAILPWSFNWFLSHDWEGDSFYGAKRTVSCKVCMKINMCPASGYFYLIYTYTCSVFCSD